jgi:hypothetical protein
MNVITTQMRTDVSKLYVSLFGRAPDSEGLGYWVNELAAKSFAEVANSMYATSPARAYYPSWMTNAEIVTSFYVNTLGRTPDDEGKAYWTAKLNAASGKVGAVIAEMIQNVVNYNGDDAAGLASKALFMNKVTVAQYYGEANGSVSGAAAVLATVTGDEGSAEATIAAIEAAIHVVPPQTFTLTTGIDTVAGGSGADTINAALSSTGADTFTSLDNVDGGAGADTMNLVSSNGNLGGAAGATVKNVEVVNLTTAGAITAANMSSWTGVEKLNVIAGGNVAGVTASATTDISVANGLAGVAVDGGKNVTVSNSTAGNINVGATTAAAGNVVATNSFAGGTVTIKAAGTETATAKGGAITFVNGTSVTATASGAVALATRDANVAAQTAATTVNTAATGDTDASGKAKLAAAAKVTALTTLATDIAAATNVSADSTAPNSIQKATATALTAGAITLADKLAIDNAFASGLATTTAAARTAAQAIVTPLQTTATAASAAAASADLLNDAAAAAAKTAADAVVAKDVAAAGSVDDVTVTAVTNTALATATVNGNYGATGVGTGLAFGTVITDSSTLKNTLTGVTLNNAAAAELTGNALTAVAVTDGLSDVKVVNTTAAHGQTFTISGVQSGTYTDANATTITVKSNGTAVNKLTGLSGALATAVNLTGTAGITIGALSVDAAAVIDASGATGKNTLSVTAGQTYKGGSGVDVVTLNNGAAQTKSVDGGAGSADVLVLRNATDFGTAAAAAKLVNFEVLDLGNGLSANLAAFTGSAFTSVVLNGGTSALTGVNATQAAAITAKASGTYTVGVTGATTVGQLDTVAITADDGLAAVNTITLTAPVLAGVETLNLTANDNIVVSSLGSALALTAINASGAGSLNITVDQALNVNTVIDAHGIKGTVTVDATTSTANGLKIIGSDTAASTLTGNTTKQNTLVAGAGNNTLKGGSDVDTITAGNGNNTIIGNGGADVITVGDGNNNITAGGTIKAGNGWNVITGSAAADTITVGTGGNLITADGGADIITFGVHAAGVVDGLVMTTGDTFNGASIVSGTTVLTGADIVTGLKAGDQINISALAAAATGAAGTSIASATGNTVALVKGNYDAATKIWTSVAAGTDTLFVYDADGAGAGTNVEAIVLVGSVVTGAAAAGIVTLA